MKKGILLQKFIAIILVFCLTSINFILVGTDAVYALSNGATTIKDSNIIFDAYFKEGENKQYSKTGTIEAGEKLYIDIEAKSGLLENATIKIDNANFKLISGQVKNQYVNFINEDTNEIKLNKITYGNKIQIELPIRFEKSDNISTDYFSMENSITLSGTYKDASEKNISGTINTSLTWTNEVKTSYETTIEKYIAEESKTLVEQKIISNVEGNVLPKTKETIKIEVPKLEETFTTPSTDPNVGPAIGTKQSPPSKIYVLVNGTKIKDDEITKAYDLEKGTLEFTKEFTNGNQISWGNGTDEYTIIYIYEERANDNQEVNVAPEIKTEIYGHENQLSGNPKAAIVSGNENKGTIVDIKGITDTSDLYKGYMYSDSDETIYNENYNVKISDKADINNVNIEFVEDNFKTQEGNALSTNERTAYKKVRVNRENMKNILGQEGTITIEDAEGKTEIIDGNAQTNEQGNIEKELDSSKIKITTSKPQQEGTLNIIATKAIKGNAGYNREQLKTINSIETKMQVTTDRNEEVSESLVSTELKETTTEATLEMNNENRGNLLSAVDRNNVEFIATLKTGTIDADLFKEPTIRIILPQEVENLSINSVSALYAGNQLEVEKYNEGRNVDGRKTIEVKLKGEQIKYDNKLLDGIKLNVNTTINLNELSTSNNSKIEMIYTNENGSEKEYSSVIDVKIQSREGVILRNTLTIGEETKKTFNEEVLSQLLEVDNKQKTAKVNATIVNNYDQAIGDVSIIGKLPKEGMEDNAFGTALKNTFSANINGKININGKDAEILYSEDENAKVDSDSWKQDSENAKVYKIVVKDNKLEVGERLEVSYDIIIPEDISFNESVYQKLELSYTYQGQALTKTAASQLYTKVKTADQVNEDSEGIKEDIDGLETKVVAVSGGKELKDGDEVVEGQVIKYILTFKNNTGNDITGLKVEANHENANVFDEETHEEPDSFETEQMKKFTYILEQENKSNKNTEIDSLEDGETKTISYQIRVRENVKDVKGNIKISAKDLPEKEIKINNNVKEGKLKLTLYNHVTIDNSISKGEPLANRLTVKNISDKKLENIRVSFDIPEGMSLKEIEESDEYKVIESNDKYVEVELEQLESNESKDITIELVSNEEIKSKLINLQFYAKSDEEVYFSNEVNTAIANNEKTKIEVSQIGDIENEELKNGDKLTYIATIRNSGEEKVEGLILTDDVPEVATITSAYVERGDKKENIEDIEGNIVTKLVNDVEPEEEIKLYVETQIDTEKATEKNIVNKVEIQSDDEEIESNEVKYSLSDYVEEPEDEDDNQEGEEIEDITGDDENNEENSTITTTNSISGLAWVDENKNGIREDSEKLLSDIEVSIANVETGKYVTDEEGNKLVAKTDENGRYTFSNISSGKYMVVFKYDNITYRNTEYRASGATEETNSDVITSKVSINDDKTKYAVTDTLELTEESLDNIDAGFIENEIFDLSLNKYINKVTVQNSAGTKVKEYDKEQLAKVEIYAKQIAGSTVLMEFAIQVTNEGELPGYANEIVDYIPNDLQFSSEINKDWYASTDGNLHTNALSKELINPGETKTITLTLVKAMTDSNTGRTANTAEIAKSSNDLSIPDKDSTPGNNSQGEDDISTAEVIISIRTGLAMTIGIITIIIALAIGGIMIYTIKRKEANHE